MRPDKFHYKGCPRWGGSIAPCTCDEIQDNMVDDFQVEQPYRRSVSVPQTDPNAPHQSLASLIRAARRAGHLRPLQPYGGGRVPASAP